MLTHFPIMILGALPQGILSLFPRLITPSSGLSRVASGLAKIEAGERHKAKMSNERRFPNGGIFQRVSQSGDVDLSI